MTLTLYFFFALIILVVYNVSAVANNTSKSQQDFHHFKLRFNNSHNSSLSRGERGIYSEPYFEHEYHEPIHEPIIPAPQYIVKLIAPRKHSKDTGIAELLLVLAPLAAIPLIGSAALTTFTAMFATGGYGKRRKRDLTTRELLTKSFSDVRPVNQYFSHSMPTLISNGDKDQSYENFDTNSNQKRNSFPTNDMIWRNVETFGSKSSPNPQLVKVEDKWKGSDLDRNERTGVNKRLMHNTSESSANTAHESTTTFVKALEKAHKETMSYASKQSNGILRKRDEEEPIQREEYKISLQKSPYRRKTHIRPHFIVKNNNESVKESKKRDNKSDNVSKIYGDLKHTSGSMNFQDLSSQESEAITRKTEPDSDDSSSVKHDNNANTNRNDFNTWIPFLSNPYLVDIAKGEGKREIQELDIIQKYLNTMGRPDYNDEIIATYLSCNGMLSASNQCLERLTCQFSDSSSGLKQLEKDVSSLVIYSLLKNEHIETSFKSRLQRAAFFGRDNTGQCNFYNCPKINDQKTRSSKRRR